MESKSRKYIKISDETLRDGAQGDVVMTPVFKINHILKTHSLGWYDTTCVGWLSNPTDQIVLDYFHQEHPEISKKFKMPTLVDLGNNAKVSQLFDKFSRDERFGIAAMVTKGRPQDLEDIGVNQERLLHCIGTSIKKLKSNMPDRPVELAIEHVFNSYVVQKHISFSF